MGILNRLFSKKPEDLLARGDRLLADNHCYEARCAYEEALRLAQDKGGGDLQAECGKRIEAANNALARLNIDEAESCRDRGLHDKAMEHLELAKTLTNDAALREKTDKLLAAFKENANDTAILAEGSSCSSCASLEPREGATHDPGDIDMPLMEYYDLLIQQLPREMYGRYAGLGEEFAYSYVVASRNRHEDALELLDAWHDGSHDDIYRYEKGMILFRLGRADEALSLMADAIRGNPANSLAHMGLAMMLADAGRLDGAAGQLDAMISAGILVEQSRLLRADVWLLAGDVDKAIEGYGGLLKSSMSRAAAERLHDLLLQCGRAAEAAHVRKQFLGGCSH